MDPRTPREQQQCRDVTRAYNEGQRMPPARREAAWARLQAAIEAEAEPERPPMRRGDRRRDLWWGAAMAAAAALVLLLAARGRSPGHLAGGDANSQAAHEGDRASSEQAPIVREARPGATAAAEPELATPPPAPAPAKARPRSRLKTPELPAPVTSTTGVTVEAATTLNAELALLRAARDAIGRGEPSAALGPLEAHARQFSDGGHLIEERLLLRAQALCELGEAAAARAAGDELVRTFPNSPHARALAGHCDD